MNLFLAGVTHLAAISIGMFFLRFWSRTRDRLFAVFSIAFFMLGVERMLVAFFAAHNEAKSWVYIIRLIAFLFIIYGIIDKNRRD